MMVKQRFFPFAVAFLSLLPSIINSPVDAEPASGRQKPGSSSKPVSLPGPLPMIAVTATYPGASAQVVADTVAAPIEQQVQGVENARYLRSHCGSDGTYILHVAIRHGTDLDAALGLVKNRVSLALPVLPKAVQRLGVDIRKQSPGVALIVPLISPEGRFDTVYVGNYAMIQIKDELLRLPGVAEVVLVGATDYGLTIYLDPEKLASRRLAVSDVLHALKQQNLMIKEDGGGKSRAPEKSFKLKLDTLGRLERSEELGELILKTDAQLRVVKLKDVASVELGAGGRQSTAYLDGKPAVALVIYPTPESALPSLTAKVRKTLAFLSEHFPDGLALGPTYDFTADSSHYLLVDPVLPVEASQEKTELTLQVFQGLLKKVDGVRDVLTLSENPFGLSRRQPRIVLQLEAAGNRAVRDKLIAAIRSRLAQAEDLPARLGETGRFPPGQYPIELAISGPELPEVRKLADRLAERLAESKQLTDVLADTSGAPLPQVYLDVDRAAIKRHGVQLADLFASAQVYLGSFQISNLDQFGRTSQIRVQALPGKQLDDLLKLKIRNAEGTMVPLADLVRLRKTTGVALLEHLDGLPMVAITANPKSGVPLSEIRRLCETQAEEVRKHLKLPVDYRLTWLQELSGPLEGDARASAPRPAPLDVTVVQPVSKAVTDYEDFTGRTDASQSVDLRARVTGYLEKVDFRDGAEVKKGQVLFEIDSRPYLAEQQKAEAALALAEVRRRLAETAAQRAAELLANKAIGKEEYDQAAGKRAVADAAIRVAQSDVEAARLKLSFTRVTAPINGRIGRHVLDVGNLVKADETTLATIVNVDPIYVSFDMDERTMLRLLRLAREGKNASPRDTDVPVIVGLADEEGFPRHGTIRFVDNRLDAATGALRVRAVLPNPNVMLVPGLFARIRVSVGAPHQALLIPDAAIVTDQGQRVVYTVDNQNTVVPRRVIVSGLHDGLRAVETGLEQDSRVILGGVTRVTPGVTVNPQPAAAPARKPE
jgi:RND family efflux transporter MFP subunit